MTWEQVHGYLRFIPARPASNLEPQYNIAPTDGVFILRRTRHGRVLERARWDLIPAWWNKPLKEKKFATFNARCETLTETASYKTAWQKGRRCVVPMNFYEWRRPTAKGRPPLYIYPAKAPFFLMAGLWDEWTDPETGEVILSCAVITCGPNEFMKPLHDRMPVILGADQVDAWLNASPEEALRMLKPCPSDWMTGHPVSAFVNSVRNQGPDCVAPASPDA